jgi:hypothetical protein
VDERWWLATAVQLGQGNQQPHWVTMELHWMEPCCSLELHQQKAFHCLFRNSSPSRPQARMRPNWKKRHPEQIDLRSPPNDPGCPGQDKNYSFADPLSQPQRIVPLTISLMGCSDFLKYGRPELAITCCEMLTRSSQMSKLQAKTIS